MRVRDAVFFIALGGIVGAGGCVATDFWLNRDANDRLATALVELDESRRSLESARARSDSLERGLYEARGIAVESSKAVGDALVAANGIADRGQRIVKLVEAIRGVVKDLKRISEAGSLIGPP